MRKFLLILLAVLPISIYSQVDSTTIHYKYLENKDLKTICELTNVQIIKVFCDDTTLKGKVFNVIIKEFKKGKIASTFNLNISSEKQEIPMVVNGDTTFYVLDFVDKAGFGNSTESLTISFAGLLNRNEFKLKIAYPGMSTQKVLKGKSNFSLRSANSCSRSKLRIPLNTEYPVLAYTPPFSGGSGIQSYCLLGEENVNNWYDKYKVKHYYIIYLEIR
jgi:hypothetical protein